MITYLKQINVSFYNNSLIKRLFDLGLSIFIFVTMFPLILTLVIFIKIFSGSPAFFVQKRIGKNGKAFKILKFRTMKKGSERERMNYFYLNETGGFIFKIRDDPRFTKIGKYLSHSGLDELPQLVNVIKGDMSLVGPRPLPVYEYIKLSKKQKMRNLIKPGITSPWIINGAHNLSFNEWMKLDKKYIEKANLLIDLYIVFKTVFIPIRTVINYVFKKS